MAAAELAQRGKGKMRMTRLQMAQATGLGMMKREEVPWMTSIMWSSIGSFCLSHAYNHALAKIGLVCSLPVLKPRLDLIFG